MSDAMSPEVVSVGVIPAEAVPSERMPSELVEERAQPVRFPLMELPLVSAVLAFVAGTLNGWTQWTSHTFATVQSGNIVFGGYWLAQGDPGAATPHLVSVLCFGVGALTSGAISTSLQRRGQSFSGAVLTTEAAVLVAAAIAFAVAGADGHHVAYGISFVAGAQGTTFHKDHGMLYGNVAVTMAVQMAFNFLVQSLFSRQGVNGEPNLTWSGRFFLVLLGFGGGGAIGVLAAKAWGGWALLLPAGIVLAVALLAARGHMSADPTPGGQIT
jgi:uncharacterized membrane protein YoaK (UPF0700 family)